MAQVVIAPISHSSSVPSASPIISHTTSSAVSCLPTNFSCDKHDNALCNKAHVSVNDLSNLSNSNSYFVASVQKFDSMNECDKVVVIWHNRLGHPSTRVLDKVLHAMDDHITSRNVPFL